MAADEPTAPFSTTSVPMAPVAPPPPGRPEPEAMRTLQREAAALDATPPATPPSPHGPAGTPGGARRHRRRVVVALAVVVGLLLLGGLALRDDGTTPESSAPGAPGVDGQDREPEAEGGPVDLAVDHEGIPPGFALGDQAGDGVGSLEGIDIADEWPGPGGGVTGGGDPGTFDPAPPPDPQPDGGGGGGGDVAPDDDPGGEDPKPSPADPCADLDPGANLVTTPAPKHLNPGSMSSTVTIRNCGADPVAWTAATKPSVSLSEASGSLAGGAEHPLGFTIDAGAFPDAAITFKIKISEPGFNQYVDISATKAGLADAGDPPPDPGGTITTGGPDGCAASCITKAWLTPNATTPNLGLDVATTTPARLRVFVSTGAPVAGPDGLPAFPEGGLIAATNDLVVVWSSILAPLAPSTDYHIIVRATDDAGGVSSRAGTFRTTSPAVAPDAGLADAGGDSGCSAQCITKAWLTPDPASFGMDLEVSSHTLARFEAYLSAAPPALDDDGRPQLEGVAPTTTNFAYETAWTTRFEALEPATRYHLVVKATDGMFRSSYQIGSFETAPGPNRLLVSFHQVQVHRDGDHGANRGELTFAFAVGEQHVASTNEAKISSGSTVHLSDGDRWPGLSTSVDFDPSPSGWLPLLSAVAFERDADGLAEFCSMGDRLRLDQGHDDACDMKWDVATSGLIRTDALSSLPSCADLGVDAVEVASARCLQLDSVGNGDDYPRFSVIVSLQTATV